MPVKHHARQARTESLALRDRIFARHLRGWTDAEQAEVEGCSRENITKHRHVVDNELMRNTQHNARLAKAKALARIEQNAALYYSLRDKVQAKISDLLADR